jgi:PD-(D/E)XK nuclease superfamily
MRLSYSGGNLAMKCHRKWYLKYVLKVSVDADSQDDALALREGKAMHTVLEYSYRDASNYKEEYLITAARENNLDDASLYKVYACLYSYYRLHAPSGLRVAGTEVEVGDETYVGYIDSIMVDKNGYWWMEDTKSSGMVMETIFSRLEEDQQLNLYAFYAPQVAEKLKLSLHKFAGARYRVVQKPRIVPRVNEPLKDFARRADAKAYDVEIPVTAMNPAKAYQLHMQLRGSLLNLTEETACPNRQSCIDYNRPCEYWSHCHKGKTFTECKDGVKVFTYATMTDRTIATDADILGD